MKEKYDKELQIATDKVRLHKEELLSMENKLGKTEDRLKTTEMKLDECVQNLSNKNVVKKKNFFSRHERDTVFRLFYIFFLFLLLFLLFFLFNFLSSLKRLRAEKKMLFRFVCDNNWCNDMLKKTRGKIIIVINTKVLIFS